MREETERLLTVRGLVESRIKSLSFELEVLKHALERVKTLIVFEEAMKGGPKE